MDREVSNEFQKILTKQGIQFKLNNKVTAVTKIKNKVAVDYTNSATAAEARIECDKVLVSVGRKPYTEGLNLSKIGIKKCKPDKKVFFKSIPFSNFGCCPTSRPKAEMESVLKSFFK